MNLFALIDFINIFIAFYLGALVYSKDSSNKLNRAFFVNTLLAAYTVCCEYFRLTSENQSLAYIWHKASILWPFFPFIFLKIVLIMTRSKYDSNKIINVLLIVPAILISSLHLFTDLLYTDLFRYWYGWEYIIARNFFSQIVPIYFLITGSISLYLMYRYYADRKPGRQKKQALFALIGLSIPMFTGFIVEGFMPQLGIKMPPLNALAFVLGTIFLSISILKYKFLTIDPLNTIRKLFSTIADYMLIYDRDGTVLISSNSLLECLKHDEESVVGNKVENLFDNNNEFFNSGLLDSTGKEIELSLLNKEGEPIPVSVIVSVIGDESKKDMLFLLLGRDLRERKHFEHELLLMQKSLEEKVKVRTTDLSRANEKLLDEIQMRTIAENRIQIALQEKETLLKEIHHRVKNNLQIISSLLFLQSQKVTDPITMEIFQESQNRVRAMALIHEYLYLTKDFSRIEFSNYIKNLSTFIYDSYHNSSTEVIINYELDETYLPLDVIIPLGLILNELLSNTLKYAFNFTDNSQKERKNNIWIQLKDLGDNKYFLSVADNGKGLPQNFSLDTSDSLGLRLVNTLVNQINGKFELLSNDKTEFRIYFSIDEQLNN